MTLNGGKVTDDLLTPGWSKYNKTCLYDIYDVTKSLRTGRNAVGLFLGNGMSTCCAPWPRAAVPM